MAMRGFNVLKNAMGCVKMRLLRGFRIFIRAWIENAISKPISV